MCKGADSYWKKFLEETGRPADLAYTDCFHFDVTEEWAGKLLALVLEGKKRATASSLHFFEARKMPLPKAGDCSIVTDWAGTPRCVIETTGVTILPFREVTFDIAKREGEDETLASWQENHIRFFTQDGEAEGYVFTWDMPGCLRILRWFTGGLEGWAAEGTRWKAGKRTGSTLVCGAKTPP